MLQKRGCWIFFILMISFTPIFVQGQLGEQREEPMSLLSVDRVSVDSQGTEGNGSSGEETPSLSADGRFVAFASQADNLAAGDLNHASTIFVRDRQTGQTTQVSISREMRENRGPSISADGRFVAFHSLASDLIVGDRNRFTDVFVHDRQLGQTTRVSVSSEGTEGNSGSLEPSISGDGRFVAFVSYASNLVEGDMNGTADVFVHDRQISKTTRVSLSSNGEEGNVRSERPRISADGSCVVFISFANNLVAEDQNAKADIFVYDFKTGLTTRVSVSSEGEEGNNNSNYPSISADGRFVAFASSSSNLLAEESNGHPHVFVHDRQTGQTTLVSLSSGGEEGNSGSLEPSISADGRFVAFVSNASNLVAEDHNGVYDIFVHDRQTGQALRVSNSSNGEEGNNRSFYSSISGDGSLVAFTSLANNFVSGSGDNNGVPDVFVAHLQLAQPAVRLNDQAAGNFGVDLPLPPPRAKFRCNDSDRGNSPRKFGITTLYSTSRMGVKIPVPFFDACCNKGYQKEFFCQENQVRHQWYQCGCRDGACPSGPMQQVDNHDLPRECR